MGERGPELAYFGGGEGVLNARATKAMISALNASPVPAAMWHGGGGGTEISMPVNVTVQGNAGSDTVEALRDWGNEFARHVLDVIAEAENDRRRTSL